MTGQLVDAPLDFWLWQAEQEVLNLFGDRVSVSSHRAAVSDPRGFVTDRVKGLNKFGRTLLGTIDQKTTVGEFQGTEYEETFVTTNAIDSIVSDDALDLATISVKGHSISPAGLLTVVDQDVTLNGLTPVLLPTPIARGSRLVVVAGTFLAPAVPLVGNVYLYDSVAATGVTAGVPDIALATKCMIVAGDQQSAKCATSVGSDEYWIVTSMQAGIERQTPPGARADVDIEYREIGGVWLPLGLELVIEATDFVHVPNRPYRIIPPNTDVRLVAETGTTGTFVGGSINGILAAVEEVDAVLAP